VEKPTGRSSLRRQTQRSPGDSALRADGIHALQAIAGAKNAPTGFAHKAAVDFAWDVVLAPFGGTLHHYWTKWQITPGKTFVSAAVSEVCATARRGRPIDPG